MVTFMDLRNCSIHGLAQFFGQPSRIRKIGWMIVYCSVMMAVVPHIERQYEIYSSKPKFMQRQMRSGPIDFPAVTLCNNNAIKRDAIWRVPELAALEHAYDVISTEMVEKSTRKKRQTDCPNEWLKVNDICYWLNSEDFTFAEAQKACTDQDSRSVPVWFQNEAESTAFIRTQFISEIDSTKSYLVGIRRTEGKYEVETSPGKYCSVPWFDKWFYDPVSDTDCVVIESSGLGWFPVACYGRNSLACENMKLKLVLGSIARYHGLINGSTIL